MAAPYNNFVFTTTFTANGTITGEANFIFIDNRGGETITLTDQNDTNNIISVRANTVLNLNKTDKTYPEYALVVPAGGTVDITVGY